MAKNYQKGNYVVLPNKNYLHLLTKREIEFFVHLCDFADENGQCFPNRRTLAERMHLKDLDSITRLTSNLKKKGFIETVIRKRKDGSNTSNLFQLIELDPPAGVAGGTRPTVAGTSTKPINKVLSDSKKESMNKLFNFWNESKGLVTHTIFSQKMKDILLKRLNEGYTEKGIAKTIVRYEKILTGEGYWLKKRWTFLEFLKQENAMVKMHDLKTSDYKASDNKKKQYE